MGKSSKAKKRKRSPSSDRLAGLESRIDCLIDVLKQREVRTPAHSLSPISQDNQRSRNETESAGSVSPVSLDEQVETADPITSGVSSVIKEGASPRSHTEVTLDENSSLLFPTTEEEVAPLTKQLFGSDLEGEQAPPWNEIVTQRWRDLTRNGLSPDQREPLLRKYSPAETLAFLKAPTLNQECKVALKNSSLIKRDEYNAKNHDQIGIALCALGEAISDFLRPGTEESLSPEACLAVAKVNEGAKILADLFYRLSLTRRAQIIPALNLNAKNTAEAIPVDDLLFGSDFGEQMKKVAAMEKSSKEIIKTPLAISRRIQQPVKQPLQMSASRSGNNRAPVRNSRPARRTGATNSSRRSAYRSRSHSRRR
ncbi:uncharacterized protein LOC120358783 [Solenopsis invicta]|uniref:uncharacterized protein LOC120358783 n=1 Tax=Solenopsis invicta TaxID=13686 RepID=UPI00193CC17E|nr:uncharacterized protein LOC120358783 [Solenopsis invicta]